MKIHEYILAIKDYERADNFRAKELENTMIKGLQATRLGLVVLILYIFHLNLWFLSILKEKIESLLLGRER